MSTLIINDVTLELDLLDADVLEKYQALNEEIVEKIKEPTQYEGISIPEGMRKQCRYVDEFFDRLFFPGTSAKVFGNNNNLRIRLDGFGQVSALAQTVGKEVSELTAKYAPRAMNREQRRAQSKNKNKSIPFNGHKQ